MKFVVPPSSRKVGSHFGIVELHLSQFVYLTKGSVAKQLAQDELTAIKESHVVVNVLGVRGAFIVQVVVPPRKEAVMQHHLVGLRIVLVVVKVG